jgi:hypothetical protein
MKIRRDLIIVALAIFCLTTAIFMVRPTKSQSDTDIPINPWADINDSGQVDIYDAILLANAFNKPVDPAKTVNVTNIPGQVIETNLTIYIDNYGFGYASTSNFSTEGYDRMFVAFAITQTSMNGYWDVTLYNAGWIWGTINGTSVVTYSKPVNNDSLTVSTSPSSTLPVSTYTSAEFAVQSAQCELQFYSSGIKFNWVTIGIWVYLTVGTTSPPAVQKTEVTNWPYQQAEPAYSNPWLYTNTTVWSTSFSIATYVNIGGYSRMTVSIMIDNSSYHTLPLTVTVTLAGVSWGTSSYLEYPGHTVNVTYSGTEHPYYDIYSPQIPAEFETKSSYCTLWFTINAQAGINWLEWAPIVYLRNE